MLRVRTGLAIGMVVVGALLVVRMLAYGVQPGIAPGVLIGGLIIALGLYRLRQMRGLGGGRR